VYQKANAPGEQVALSHEAQDLSVLPYHVPMVNPCKRDYEFEVNSGGVAESYQLSTLGWMIVSALSSQSAESDT